MNISCIVSFKHNFQKSFRLSRSVFGSWLGNKIVKHSVACKSIRFYSREAQSVLVWSPVFIWAFKIIRFGARSESFVLSKCSSNSICSFGSASVKFSLRKCRQSNNLISLSFMLCAAKARTSIHSYWKRERHNDMSSCIYTGNCSWSLVPKFFAFVAVRDRNGVFVD